MFRLFNFQTFNGSGRNFIKDLIENPDKSANVGVCFSSPGKVCVFISTLSGLSVVNFSFENPENVDELDFGSPVVGLLQFNSVEKTFQLRHCYDMRGQEFLL